MKKFAHIVPLAAARNKDLAVVGGKNASLGELIGELAAAGVRVPDGFATTADAYRAFLRAASLRDLIDRKLESADIDSPDDLARAAAAIRDGILAAALPPIWIPKFAPLIDCWTTARAANAPSPCALRRPPRICRKRLSPASRTLF